VTGLAAGEAYDFRVQAMSGGGISSAATTTSTTLTPYQQWKVDNNLPMNTADSVTPDSDGIPILLKYATGMAVGAPGGYPVASSAPGGSPLTLTFRRLSPAPVTYAIQASTDMSAWTTIATLTKGSDVWSGSAGVQETGAGSSRSATVTDTTSIPTASRRFLRLQVAP